MTLPKTIFNQPLSICKGHMAVCSLVALIIVKDFNFAMLEYTSTEVGGPKINSNCCPFGQECSDTVKKLIRCIIPAGANKGL